MSLIFHQVQINIQQVIKVHQIKVQMQLLVWKSMVKAYPQSQHHLVEIIKSSKQKLVKNQVQQVIQLEYYKIVISLII